MDIEDEDVVNILRDTHANSVKEIKAVYETLVVKLQQALNTQQQRVKELEQQNTKLWLANGYLLQSTEAYSATGDYAWIADATVSDNCEMFNHLKDFASNQVDKATNILDGIVGLTKAE